MAKIFADVIGLHNVFKDAEALKNNTTDNKLVTDDSILYITADEVDEEIFKGYKIISGDSYVYAKRKLIGNHTGGSVKFINITDSSPITINEQYDAYFITYSNYDNEADINIELVDFTGQNKIQNVSVFLCNYSGQEVKFNFKPDESVVLGKNSFGNDFFKLKNEEISEFTLNIVKTSNANTGFVSINAISSTYDDTELKKLVNRNSYQITYLKDLVALLRNEITSNTNTQSVSIPTFFIGLEPDGEVYCPELIEYFTNLINSLFEEYISGEIDEETAFAKLLEYFTYQFNCVIAYSDELLKDAETLTATAIGFGNMDEPVYYIFANECLVAIAFDIDYMQIMTQWASYDELLN